MKKTSGIYSITNTVNGRRYVGSTRDYSSRIGTHFWLLRKGKHGNRNLQTDFNECGEAAFVAALIEQVPIELLLDTEQKHLDKNKGGYNIYADSHGRGAKHSQETRAKIGDANRVRIFSQETRDKMSASGKVKVFSPEHIANMSASGMGRIVSQETRDKIGAAHKGKIYSPETRAKMRAAQNARDKRPLKPVFCTTNNTRYKSQKDAARELNVFASNISAVVRGKLKSTGGYKFILCE